MDLIIVESPTKARTLSRFLSPNDYRIEATMGHLRDLPEKKLGIKIENDFEPEYVINPKKKDIVLKLQKLSGESNSIYLASDPDREGEAIAYHVAEILINNKPKKLDRQQFKRITFHEITETAIKHSLQNPGEINKDLVEAQTSRRILDRLVGYKLSPLLWRKIRKGLSAGRVQSVAVRLIVEREKEIEKFVSVEYWDINVWLSKSDDSADFWVKLIKKNGDPVELKNNLEAEEVVGELKSAEYEVARVDQKEAKRYSLPPFTTSTLQQNAANRLSFSSKKTMQIAQSLYEQGLITYHRTDSTNIAKEAINMTRDFISLTYGQTYLPESPKFYATKSKSAQEAHEAIRPTSLIADYQSLLTNTDESRLYDLIWKRFVACQMADAIVEVTSVDISGLGNQNQYLLQTKGEVEKFAGWRILYRKNGNGGENIDDNIAETQLPNLTVKEELNLKEVKPEQKFTQPPPRYNEASLIKAMEELGIGRPSTYAPIISTIQERNYVEKENRNFKPTPLGVAVNDFLVEYFKDILDYQFTAKMEDDLDEIANGKKERVPVLKEFYEPFAQKLEGVDRVAERMAVQTEATGEDCPKCGQGSVVIRIGRFGKFLSCSRFPDCDYRAPYIQKIEGFKCPKCGGDIIYKRSKRGKGFYGCSNYPKCNWASWRKPT